jgi:hypothetical protein
MEKAHQRTFDLVLCWAPDRFNCQGMVPTVLHLQQLEAAGVGFHSTAMLNPLSMQTLNRFLAQQRF